MAEQDVHYLLLYDYVDDMLERRGPHRDAHLARIRAARDDGHLVMAGALGDPPGGGALVFRGLGPGQIEEFVRTDPYVEAGLVKSWQFERWNLV
jgi:uncharacterized protein YciI